MRKTAISLGITFQLVGILAAGLFVASAVFAQSGPVGDIPPGLEPLADELNCATRAECEAIFNADPARGIDLATKHNIYDSEKLELATTFKSQVLDELNNADPATVHEKIVEIAERLIKDNPDLARRFDVGAKNVAAARTIVTEVKEAGVDLTVCSKSADLLTRPQLISCLNASKRLSEKGEAIEKFVSKERIAVAGSSEFDASLRLQEALNAGEYSSLNAATPDELGQICLRPGSPQACEQIAARFFGPQGVEELARARAQVSKVEAQYRKGSESLTLTTSSGKKITGKDNIKRACEEAFSTKNIPLARACGDFAIKNGLASPEDVSEGIGFLESVGATNIDLSSCRKNPDACSQFIPEGQRNDFGVMRQIHDIMATEIGFDPVECEQGGFNQDIGLSCLEGAKRALPRIRAIAATPEAQRIVREIEGRIAESNRFQEQKGGFDEVFKGEGGPGGCHSSFECFSYCSDPTHGPECVSWGAKQGIFAGDEAIRRFEEYNAKISAPGTVRFDQAGQNNFPSYPNQPLPGLPNQPAQVPLFPGPSNNQPYPASYQPSSPGYYQGPAVGPSPECFAAIQSGDFARAKEACQISGPNYYQPQSYPNTSPGPSPTPFTGSGESREQMIETCLRTGTESREACAKKVDNYLASGGQNNSTVRCNELYKDQASCRTNPSCSWQGNYCQSNSCPRTFASPPQCSSVDSSLHDGQGRGPRGCAVCTLTDRAPKPVEKSICPALPSVNQCGPNENRIVTFQSEACGTYYGCQPKLTTTKIPVGAIFPYTFSNGVLVKTADEARGYCYTNPPGSGQGVAAECENRFGVSYGAGPDPLPPGAKNWVDKTWTFSDGSSVFSSILNRTDSEYTNYIKGVEGKCRTIPQSRFSWRPSAGDDRASNWQNFGIPDCSGSGTQVYGKCQANSSKTSCYAQSGCRWFINPDGFEYCEGDNFVPPTPKCTTYFQESLCGKDPSCEWKIPPLGGIGWCQVRTYVAPKTDACSSVGNGWHQDYIDAGQVVCFNNSHDQYKIGANPIRSCVATSISGCYNNAVAPPSNQPAPGTPPPSTNPNYAGDAYSCPGFAQSKWDKNGSRYCQLNLTRSCNYVYPSYLNQANYKPENCPAETPVYGDCQANLDQSKCYNQPGCLWFATSGGGYCQGDNYTPPAPTTAKYPYTFKAMSFVASTEQAARDYCGGMAPGSGSPGTPTYVASQAECQSLGLPWGGSGTSNPPPSSNPTYPSSGTTNWVNHTWKFKDSNQYSSILSRTDAEYKNFIATVDAETAKGYFAGWSAGGGDQSNWREFGIPIVSLNPPATGTTGSSYPPAASSGSCTSTLIGLLGDGCHNMGNAWFDGPMNKYVYPGTTAVKNCSTEWISGCSGGSGSYTPPSSGSSSQCPTGYHFENYEGASVICFADGGNHDIYKIDGGTAISCSTTYRQGCPGASGSGSTVSGETCGNNFCGAGETASSCPSDCGSVGGSSSSGGGSCPQYGFGNPDGSYACNYGTCSNGCNFDSQGCPVSCYASSGGSAPSGGDPQTECTNYGGTYDAANNYCQMPGSPPSSGNPASDCANYGGTWDAANNYCQMPGSPPSGGYSSDPATGCAEAGGSWDAGNNFCQMPGQTRLQPKYLLGQLNTAFGDFGRLIVRLLGF